MAATAQALLPFDVWPSGITQAATPANDNALRAEVIASPALSLEATQPGSPTNGDLYILSSAWGEEVAGTLAFYRDGWTYWVPFEGMLKEVGPVMYQYVSGAWQQYYASLGDYADDAAAAVGGVVVGQLYRSTSTLKVRVA